MAILEVNHIEKHFGNTEVLQDVSFSLEEGKALAIIGSSGSGKTTLLRCLNFLEVPDGGTISVRVRYCSTPRGRIREEMRSFGRNVCILAWCSRRFTCSRSIRRCRM